jgi:membrane protease YdiL (CAAX protease family)
MSFPSRESSLHGRVRPIPRLLLFVALVAVLWTAKNIFLELLRRLISPPSSPYLLLLEEVLQFAAVYLAALVLSRLERVAPGVYGLPLRGAFRKSFWQGCGFGLLEITVLMGLISLFGGYSPGSLALHGPEILRWGLVWAAAFLFVGLFEEFAFRGYVLHTLSESIGFWPAAFLLAIGFGALHASNPGESLVGEAGIAAIALVFALTLRRTGSLWLAVGWHAAYDFGETFLYSVPDSGGMFSNHLSNASLQGSVWLTGGTVGPEGSAFGFLLIGLFALLVHVLYPSPQGPAPPAVLDAEPSLRSMD